MVKPPDSGVRRLPSHNFERSTNQFNYSAFDLSNLIYCNCSSLTHCTQWNLFFWIVSNSYQRVLRFNVSHVPLYYTVMCYKSSCATFSVCPGPGDDLVNPKWVSRLSVEHFRHFTNSRFYLGFELVCSTTFVLHGFVFYNIICHNRVAHDSVPWPGDDLVDSKWVPRSSVTLPYWFRCFTTLGSELRNGNRSFGSFRIRTKLVFITNVCHNRLLSIVRATESDADSCVPRFIPDRYNKILVYLVRHLYSVIID